MCFRGGSTRKECVSSQGWCGLGALCIYHYYYFNGHTVQPDWTDQDVGSHHKACPAVAWRRRSSRSIWRRRWPGPRWTPLQTRRLLSEQPPASPSHTQQGQGQMRWDRPVFRARGCLLSLQQSGIVTNSKTLFKHAIRAAESVVGRHNSHTAGYDTAMRNFSQGNITAIVSVQCRKFCGGTLCGDIKWRVTIANQLATREDQPTESVQCKIRDPSL